jgi:hypothetical protein
MQRGVSALIMLPMTLVAVSSSPATEMSRAKMPTVAQLIQVAATAPKSLVHDFYLDARTLCVEVLPVTPVPNINQFFDELVEQLNKRSWEYFFDSPTPGTEFFERLFAEVSVYTDFLTTNQASLDRAIVTRFYAFKIDLLFIKFNNYAMLSTITVDDLTNADQLLADLTASINSLVRTIYESRYQEALAGAQRIKKLLEDKVKIQAPEPEAPS